MKTGKLFLTLLFVAMTLTVCKKKDEDNTPAIVYGCRDVNSINYNPNATQDDGSCIPIEYGCMDTSAYNYNPSANTDDGSCIPKVYGCTDPAASNYNAAANTDNGTCLYDSGRVTFYSSCFGGNFPDIVQVFTAGSNPQFVVGGSLTAPFPATLPPCGTITAAYLNFKLRVGTYKYKVQSTYACGFGLEYFVPFIIQEDSCLFQSYP